MGAPFVDSGVLQSTGAVYGLFGGPSLTSRSPVDLSRDPPDILLQNSLASERLGDALAVADHNGDGVGDVAVAASRATRPGVVEAGRVLLINGTATDSDSDGRLNLDDNCRMDFNPTRAEFGTDGLGDASDPDDDGDHVPDIADCGALDGAVFSVPGEIDDLEFDLTAASDCLGLRRRRAAALGQSGTTYS